MDQEETLEHVLQENKRRNAANNKPWSPVSGKNSIGERKAVTIRGLPVERLWLPVGMLDVPFVKRLVKAGSVEKFAKGFDADVPADSVIDQFVRIRIRYDFPFWAAAFVRILSKTPGEGEIPFILTRPQRYFVERLEEKRLAGKPIRFVLLKARQWGGSTTSQLYMAWLQLVHKPGLNSAIIAQTKKTSFAIKDMYDRALKSYPNELLYPFGEKVDNKQPKMENVGLSGDFKRIPQRDCTITIASYEAPDAIRGGTYALVHCSEVGLWQPTDRKTPDSVVGSMSGIPLAPYTMVIYESTAKGSGNFFHREYVAARDGKSQFDAIFIAWKDIDNLYSIPFESKKKEREFAKWLIENRSREEAESNREEPGTYLWRLWQQGATLEGINWYIEERKGKDDHATMASEYPTDDIEAFTFSGRKVFNDEEVDRLEPSCRPAAWVGDIEGRAESGEDALENIVLRKDPNGRLLIWKDVEPDTPTEKVIDRYLVVVDVCKGLSESADYAVITVFDRLFIADGDKPEVVAQWRGRIDMDLLAWKSAQIAEHYNHCLLVIESNTLESNHTRGEAEFILSLLRDAYDNLYARKPSEEDIRTGAPRKYGFHTNRQTKRKIISALKSYVRDGLYIERDSRCLEEYKVYVETDKGGYEAPKGYHDDLLMTRAIGLFICYNEMDIPRVINIGDRKSQHRKVINEASF